MSTTTGQVSEQEARAVAEAARETEWAKPSFVQELFLGRLRLDLINPPPQPDPEVEARTDAFLARVEPFLREKVDAEAIERDDHVPPEVIDGLKELGAFGMKIPVEYGGLGLSQRGYNRAVSLIGAYCAPLGVWLSAHQSIGVPQPLALFGTEEQKRKYLPRLATGELIGSFALTEPDSGSDAASLRTSARLDGDSYVLNGTKRFITNAPQAGIFTVMARTDPDRHGAAGVSAFIVEAGTPGLRLGKRDKKMGQQGAHTCDVIFENCRVPTSQLIGDVEGQGFKTAMKVLDRGRLHIAAVCVGVAERLIADSLAYAKERKQFGKAIGEFQLIQAMLADSRTEAYAGRCMVLDAAARRDAGENVSTEASCCKLFCTEMVGRVADRAVQIHGGAGYIADYGIERFYRDVRLFRLYEGTSQIQQLVIARNMLRD